MVCFGVVLSKDDEEIRVYNKDTEGFVKTVDRVEENSNLEIGDIVEINENEIRRVELPQYKLLIKKEGKLKFSIENIFVGIDKNPIKGIFEDLIFGVVDDSNSMLDFVDYVYIEVTQRPQKTDKFFWKLSNCRRRGERYRDGPGNEDADNDVDRVTDRYSKYPELMMGDARKNEEQENKILRKIGTCRIVGFDNSDVIHGRFPILKPEKRVSSEIMNQLSDGAYVCMKKLKGDEDTYVMDLPIGTIFVENKMIQIKLTKETREHGKNLKVGDEFTLESVQIERNIDFWMSKKHGNNHLLLETLQDCEVIRNKVLLKEANEAPLPSDSSDDEEFQAKNRKLKVRQQKKRAKREAIANSTNLNVYQKEAVRLALDNDNEFVLIQGPPGTGKTHTLADIICEMVLRKQQVLVVTPTRFARDNIQKTVRRRIEERGMKIHQNTLMDQEKHDILLQQHPLYKDIQAFAAERDENPDDEDKMFNIKKTINELKTKATQEIFMNTSVVFSTINNAFVDISQHKTNFQPKTMILDEAGQLCEAHFWPRAHRMERVVLAGDPQQLSAVVLSDEARDQNLDVSLMERLFREDKKNHFVLLRTQYRMNSKIMGWSSQEFYESKLEADESVANIEISSIPKMKPKLAERIPIDVRFRPLAVCDTGAEKDSTLTKEYYESCDDDGSFCNMGEAQLIGKHVYNLIQRSVPPSSIAVITPYKGQKTLIRGLLKALFNNKLPVEVDTVDAFQGQERDIILFSLVRNNPVVALGFINDTRRLNVAITRAKRQFFMVGSLWMLKNTRNPQLLSLFEYIKKEAQILTPKMIRNEHDFTPDTVDHLFGKYFELFIEDCKDDEMRRRCEEKARQLKAYDKVNYFRLQR